MSWGAALVVSVVIACLATEITAILAPLLGVISFFLFGHLASVITQPLATKVAPSFDTFRSLSERVLALNAQKLYSEHDPMGRNDIWIVLCDLIEKTLGVEHDEIHRGAHFIKDLGCD